MARKSKGGKCKRLHGAIPGLDGEPGHDRRCAVVVNLHPVGIPVVHLADDKTGGYGRIVGDRKCGSVGIQNAQRCVGSTCAIRIKSHQKRPLGNARLQIPAHGRGACDALQTGFTRHGLPIAVGLAAAQIRVGGAEFRIGGAGEGRLAAPIVGVDKGGAIGRY